MKNTIIILFFLTLRITAQDKFVYDKSGLTDFVVLEFDSISKDMLYQKTLFWIKETYKNPDEVLKMTIENEKLRFDGFDSIGYCYNVLGSKVCTGTYYSIEVSFKENKIRFMPISFSYYQSQTKYSSGGYENISLDNGEWLYNKKGEIRDMYKPTPESFENVFNQLLYSLKNYIISDKKEDEW